jgi:hypothetical protein
LAYPENKIYAQNAVYQNCKLVIDEDGKRHVEFDNKHEFMGNKDFFETEVESERKHKAFISMITETKGWHGEKLLTSYSYDAFRKGFENIATSLPSVTLVNCSEGGVYINGYEHLSLSEALERYQIKKHSLNQLVEKTLQEQYTEAPPPSEPYQKVYAQYQQDRQDLTSLQDLTDTGIKEVQKALKELKRKKAITHSLEGRLSKMALLETELCTLSQSNIMINAYIRREMLDFTKLYGRKLIYEQAEPHEGDINALEENLESTRHLYQAIQKGAKGLLETFEPIFENFPVQPEGVLLEPSASLKLVSAGQ